MLQFILVVALIAVIFYWFVVKPTNYWKERGVTQANSVWFFGDNWRLVTRTESLTDMMLRCYNRFPESRYYGMYQGMRPTLLIRDPELVKKIAVRDFDHFTDHTSILPVDSDPIWGNNLFALKGRKWREMRSVLSPSFTSSKMKTMFTIMVDCSENFVSHYSNKDQDFMELEMKEHFSRFTNDAIATTAFGVQVDSLANPNNKFYLMGKEASNVGGILKAIKFFGMFLFPKIYEYLNVRFSSEETSDFFRDLLDETIKTREENNIFRSDMVQLLMEAKNGIRRKEENNGVETGFATVKEAETDKPATRPITNTDITAQGILFFLAGFDTVSTHLCFTAYELALNSDVQTKLREEIEETFKECKGKITYEALLGMKYMDMVISESLRKWPSAVNTDRACTKPYLIEPVNPAEQPLYIEKDTLVVIPVIGIHRDPKYYPDPERFDPERFSEENKEKINPSTYLAFGVGPRSCIGSRFALLESKILFFHLLLHFEFVPVEKTPIPMKISAKTFNLVAEGGFWLGMRRLKK